MEPARILKNSETYQNEEVWRPIELFRKHQSLAGMDYAVREHLKKQLTGHLSFHMDTLVEKGMTYDELLRLQKDFELCPSVLEFYPGKQSWIARLWQKISLVLGLF